MGKLHQSKIKEQCQQQLGVQVFTKTILLQRRAGGDNLPFAQQGNKLKLPKI